MKALKVRSMVLFPAALTALTVVCLAASPQEKSKPAPPKPAVAPPRKDRGEPRSHVERAKGRSAHRRR